MVANAPCDVSTNAAITDAHIIVERFIGSLPGAPPDLTVVPRRHNSN